MRLEDIKLTLETLYDRLAHADDLNCAILGASYIDHCLSALLAAHFVGEKTSAQLLNPTGGAIGTFAAKSRLAYCLGLLSSDCLTNLESIGQIRNIFAHNLDIYSFDCDSDLVGWCNKLSFPEDREPMRHLPACNKTPEDTEEFFSRLSDRSTNRGRFTTVVCYIASDLFYATLEAQMRMDAVNTPSQSPE